MGRITIHHDLVIYSFSREAKKMIRSGDPHPKTESSGAGISQYKGHGKISLVITSH